MKKIILDLCGGTGSWSRPYKEAGYDVRVITLPQYDVTSWRGYPEVENAVNSGDVYGIFAAPPCTEFSIAKGSKPRDLHAAMEVVKACLDIIWTARLHGKVKFWSMENPTGLLRQFLGKPAFTFQPWEYGEMYTKKTDLWGYFTEPARKVKEKPAAIPTGGVHAKYWGKVKVPSEYQNLKLDRAAIRAITPRGFAEAFFKANQ